MRGYIKRLNKDGKCLTLMVSITGDFCRRVTIYILTDGKFMMNDGNEYSKDNIFELTVTAAYVDYLGISFHGFMEVKHKEERVWRDGFIFYTNLPE